MNDLISRQLAIAYATSGMVRTLPTSEGGENWIRTKEVRQSLSTMPSAQPEIIRCKDCKYRDPEDKSCGCGHDIIWQLPRDDNWFCADGKRMVDDPSHPFANDVMMG